MLDIARYRWTEEEKDQVLDQLLQTMRPKENQKPELLSLTEVYDDAVEALNSPQRLLSSGFASLDRMTKGMGSGDLVIVYGDTSHGKSQLTQNIALNVAQRGHTVLFCGLEMTNKQNTQRFIQMGEDVRDLPILYPASNELTRHNVSEIVGLAVENGAKLVVIDQLQQMVREIANTAQEISLITAEVKRVAVQYEIPIMLISHINRTGTRQGPPTLTELKGSSSIEQDCDIALAVWRDMDLMDGRLHVVLRKNRNRGMEYQKTVLRIDQNMRLHEENDISLSALTKVFPGAKVVA